MEFVNYVKTEWYYTDIMVCVAAVDSKCSWVFLPNLYTHMFVKAFPWTSVY
jgi:hypothetical protein